METVEKLKQNQAKILRLQQKTIQYGVEDEQVPEQPVETLDQAFQREY